MPRTRVGFACVLAGLLHSCLPPATNAGPKASETENTASSPLGGLNIKLKKIESGRRSAWSDFEPRPSRHLGGCEFSGSVERLHAELYAERNQKVPVALLRQAHFRSVTPATEPGLPTIVDVEWPLVGRYLIDGPGVLRPTHEVVVVPGHLTVPPLARHYVTRGDTTHALLHVILSEKQQYRAPVECNDLTLTEAPLWDPGAPLPENARGVTAQGDLYREPGKGLLGPVVNVFGNVLVQGTAGSWAHVSSPPSVSLMFDGWMRTELLKTKPTFLGVLREEEIRPTHRTRKGAQILVDRNPTGVEITEDTPVVVAGIEDGVAEVAIAGLWGVHADALQLREEEIVPIDQ